MLSILARKPCVQVFPKANPYPLGSTRMTRAAMQFGLAALTLGLGLVAHAQAPVIPFLVIRMGFQDLGHLGFERW
jgi:hypothetical protein